MVPDALRKAYTYSQVLHSWNHSFIKKGLNFQKLPKMGGSDFFYKKGGVCRIGGLILKRKSLIFIQTNPF